MHGSIVPFQLKGLKGLNLHYKEISRLMLINLSKLYKYLHCAATKNNAENAAKSWGQSPEAVSVECSSQKSIPLEIFHWVSKGTSTHTSTFHQILNISEGTSGVAVLMSEWMGLYD